MSARLDLERALDVARRAVAKGGAAALRHHRTDLAVEHKSDETPVTVADRDSEAAIIAEIREAFPMHDLLTEESGRHGTGGDTRWIVDPLDGTKGFSRGGVLWGPIVALEHLGEMVVGAMAIPALGETYWAARGLGCYGNGTRLRVSDVSDWRRSTLVVGELPSLLASPHRDGVVSLIQSAQSTRCPGDVAGCAWVLQGIAEAWVEAGVQTWDVAASKVLIEEAGGRFSDFRGTPSVEDGTAVATNGLVHDHVLAALAR